jgi:hypothetical protein
MPDTLHIWLASLSDPRAAGVAGSVLDSCIRPGQRSWLGMLLTYELDSQRWQTSQFGFSWPHEYKTDRLKQCESLWQAYTQRNGYGPTSALLLATTLHNQDTLAKLAVMLRLCGVDPDDLDRQLQANVNQLDPYVEVSEPEGLQGLRSGNSVPLFVPGIPSNGPRRTDPNLPEMPPWSPNLVQPVESDNATLVRTIGELLRPVSASPRQMYYSLLPKEMSNFIHALVRSIDSVEMPILAGKNGSPLNMVSQVMADRLYIKQFNEPYAALRAYAGVQTLDVRTLAPHADQSDLAQALGAVFKEQMSKQSIVVLEHIEALRVSEALRDAVAKSLQMRRGAPVYGVYHIASGSSFDAAQVRTETGLPNALPLHISLYDEAQTHNLLDRFYLPLWESLGYKFDPKAFDTVIKLEPGARVEYQPKGLPYMAVDLGWGVTETVMSGEEGVRQMAYGALAALRNIRQAEWNDADAELRSLLTDAEHEIAQLSRQPRITRVKQGPIEIKRAHVTAQLLYSLNTEYHVPAYRARNMGVPPSSPPDGTAP